MGETRVDLIHLLEDLRDAYTGALEETILTEMVANALDSGARKVRIAPDPTQRALTVLDDGSGMKRRELARYHDIAASTKMRGEGIGFAGVGIKLGLLLADEVITETRRGATHVATRWHLASRHKAPWKWVPAPGAVTERGTAVTLRVANPLSPLLDSGFVESALRRHFEPLLDEAFTPLLRARYPHGVAIEVNGRPLADDQVPHAETSPLEIRLPRRRKPSAIGMLFRSSLPLPEDRRGVAISTLGKIIKRGWDWLGVTPSTPDRIGGLIEAPALAECLTLNKADFVRTGPRGATYLAYRKAIQEVVSQRLGLWGDSRDGGDERRRVARPVERDLERVLVELSDDFPLLATLVERRDGGQRRLPIGGQPHADARDLILTSLSGDHDAAVNAGEEATAGAVGVLAPPAETAQDGPAPSAMRNASASMPGTATGKRPGRYGLAIQFENRSGDPELARLVETTVWVNDAHPAYLRASASRSEGYHLALAVAMALAPLAVEPAREHGFVTAFLERWGAALEHGTRRGTRR